MYVCKQELEESLEKGVVGSKILTEEDFINSMMESCKLLKRLKEVISHTIQNNQFSSAINFICICQGLRAWKNQIIYLANINIRTTCVN